MSVLPGEGSGGCCAGWLGFSYWGAARVSAPEGKGKGWPLPQASAPSKQICKGEQVGLSHSEGQAAGGLTESPSHPFWGLRRKRLMLAVSILQQLLCARHHAKFFPHESALKKRFMFMCVGVLPVCASWKPERLHHIPLKWSYR